MIGRLDRFGVSCGAATCVVASLSCLLTGVPASPSVAAELTRCNEFNDAATTWAAVVAGSDRPLPLHSLEPPVFLPDGREFKTWEQPVEHRRTFFVAGSDPVASDNNPGTEQRPWKTIGRAATLLEPGDRVLVKEGVYREWVRPARGGHGPRRMITYQAFPGDKVVIRGSEQFDGPWKPSRHVGKPEIAKAWQADLPDTLFDGYNPFAEINVGREEAPQKYARQVPPVYTLARGLVFQHGRRLQQKATYEELAVAPGSYWVEPGGRRLHLCPFEGRDPNTISFEITTREFAFAPEKTGLGFIRVDGFHVEYVASCIPTPQRGAISTQQGHHWIVQNNTVCQVNSLGLDFGRRPTFVPYEVPEDTPKLAGVGHIIRGNAFSECGVCSLQGLGLFGGLIEDNFAGRCGWHRIEILYETGGIKLHYKKHVLVRRNVVSETFDSPGLWVDHSNANTRVTQNIVVKAQSRFGGIFLEASYLPNMIDQNIVWDCDGHGFYQHDCSDLIVANNLIGKCTKLPVLMRSGGKRVVDLETHRLASCARNQVVGNVFYGFGSRGPELPTTDNTSDYNLFVNPQGTEPFDLSAWQKRTGRESHSAICEAELSLSPTDWTLRRTPSFELLQSPRLSAVTYDFFLAPRQGETTVAGPFALEKWRPETVLATRTSRGVEVRRPERIDSTQRADPDDSYRHCCFSSQCSRMHSIR